MAGKEGLRTLNGPVAVERPGGRNGLREVSVLPDQIPPSDSLAKIGAPALVVALKHSNAAVRWNAANELGRLGDPSAAPQLAEALNDSDEHVRWSAANALWMISHPSSVPSLVVALNGEDERVKKVAAHALERLGIVAVPALVEILAGNEAKAWGRAAMVLGKIGDASAVPELLEKLNDKNVHGTARYSIAKALANIAEAHPEAPGLAEAIPAIRRALDSEGR